MRDLIISALGACAIVAAYHIGRAIREKQLIQWKLDHPADFDRWLNRELRTAWQERNYASPPPGQLSAMVMATQWWAIGNDNELVLEGTIRETRSDAEQILGTPRLIGHERLWRRDELEALPPYDEAQQEVAG